MGQDPEELSTGSMGTTGTGSAGGVVSGTSTTPADIEATRASLSRDIDELTDKVSPARVMDRRKEAAKGRLGAVRDKVMGAAPDLDAVRSHLPGGGSGQDTGHHTGYDTGYDMGSGSGGLGERASGLASQVSGTASQVSGQVSGRVSSGASGAVDSLGARAQGNPLAAGLVAFGAGMLLSALLPASDRETKVAGQAVQAAKEHGQPVVEEARSVGQQLGAELKESAVESAQQVKETAQSSVENVKAEGQSSAQTVKDEGQSSAQTIKQDTGH